MKKKKAPSKSSHQHAIDNFVLSYMKSNQGFSSCKISSKKVIQRLWSGYGEIVRYHLEVAQNTQQNQSLIVKNVHPPNVNDTSISHLRKLRSYQVETAFYEKYSCKIISNGKGIEDINDGSVPRVPRLLYNKSNNELNLTQILLEDLNEVGYPGRQGYGSNAYIEQEVKPMIQWLARFHGAFLKKKVSHEEDDQSYYPGLWEQGCYWHLDTRPDEFNDMKRGHVLKKSAKMLDRRLKHHSQFVTLLHGDSKVCNFCFSDSTHAGKYRVAAVDFQYCGGGVGLRDLCYLLHSCMDDKDLKSSENEILAYYFQELRKSQNVTTSLSGREQDALEEEWRYLWPTCFADFERFLVGWSYGHESYGYAKAMIVKALDQTFDTDEEN